MSNNKPNTLSFADLEDARPATRLPIQPSGKSPTKKGNTVMPRSAHNLELEQLAIEKFIDNVNEPNPNFEDKNQQRNLFLADKLTAHPTVREAAKAIDADMRAAKVPANVITATIDVLCYSVLKQIVFDVFVAQQKAIRLEEGMVPDSYYAAFNNRRPAPENCESDQDDIKDFSADPREEDIPAPMGCGSDYVELLGTHWQIDADVSLSKRIADELEDFRIYLEAIRDGYGYKGDRLPFFIEQVRGEWVRHNGSVYDALLSFGLKMLDKQRTTAAQTEAFYAQANTAARNAA